MTNNQNAWVSVCALCNKEWKQTNAEWWAAQDPLCDECREKRAK